MKLVVADEKVEKGKKPKKATPPQGTKGGSKRNFIRLINGVPKKRVRGKHKNRQHRDRDFGMMNKVSRGLSKMIRRWKPMPEKDASGKAMRE